MLRYKGIREDRMNGRFNLRRGFKRLVCRGCMRRTVDSATITYRRICNQIVLYDMVCCKLILVVRNAVKNESGGHILYVNQWF